MITDDFTVMSEELLRELFAYGTHVTCEPAARELERRGLMQYEVREFNISTGGFLLAARVSAYTCDDAQQILRDEIEGMSFPVNSWPVNAKDPRILAWNIIRQED